MRIDHIAIWTHDLERLKDFYQAYFGAQAGQKYRNARTGFESYFLTFADGARLEIMTRPGLPPRSPEQTSPQAGYAHLSFAAGSREEVDRLTAALAADGFPLLDGPRTTGDGYYESQLLDPDGNPIEITI